MSERHTFSPFWHRVRALKPRLRPHVQITRQRFQGGRWHVAHDPSSNAFYRLSPVQNEFVGLLDGTRTVDEVWQLGLTRHGDGALTQNDVIQVLGQLYAGNLLQADVPPETEQLLNRGRDRLKKRALGQAIGLMYFRVPLFNPNVLLTKVEPIFRPILNRVGLVAWFALVIAAIFAIIPQWKALRSGFDTAIAPSNWIWMGVVFIAVKLWHEFGHGVLTKRFGGQVPVFGAMMLVLIPSPFVDCSSAWSFPNKWQRIVVAAGGMMFELFLASIAAFVWLGTRENPGLVHQLSYNVLISASVSTIVFNANPLMRFDGYFILSDLLGVPNLMQRSMTMLKFLFLKHVYRVENPPQPTGDAREALILLVYGVLAMIYRVVIFISVTLYVLGKMFGLGLVLAVWTAAMWFILPVGQLVHWLATGPQLSHKRGRAILATLAMVAGGLLLIGVVKFPDYRRAAGVVESAKTAGLYAGSDGILAAVHVKPGQHVKAGDAVATIENPDLIARLAYTKAQLSEAVAREMQASAKSATEAQIAREYVETLEQALTNAQGKVEKLVIRAPHDGVVVLAQAIDRVGMFIQEGTPICDVIDDKDLRVSAALTQSEADWIASLPPDAYKVEMRRKSRVHEVIEGRTADIVPAARKDVAHSALLYQGGGTIASEQGQQGELLAKSAVFTGHFVAMAVEPGITTGGSPDIGLPGERVSLRFTLPKKPLLTQWLGRLEKTLQGRARI
ncbi:MAG: HlyD family efflux transporter periplasmic adaptor subunit [Phycisphaerales bacterium]